VFEEEGIKVGETNQNLGDVGSETMVDGTGEVN